MSISVSTDFSDFCSRLKMPDADVSNIIYRYHAITRRINKDFRDLDSDVSYSFYVGSYGRGTEIYTSDIDIVVVLPYEVYVQYNNYAYNGQSQLLQAVKNSLKKTYSSSTLNGDGQVVDINFSDGIKFEIVPAFINKDGSYTYPDSNEGGRWRVMNPKAEINEFNTMNKNCNSNLTNLCKMVREWNRKNGVCMPGILIDTIAYRFLSNYQYKDKSYLYYDYMSRDFFKYLHENADQEFWVVPGSGWHVKKKYSFKLDAKYAYEKCLKAIEYYNNKQEYSYYSTWREIYGSKF